MVQSSTSSNNNLTSLLEGGGGGGIGGIANMTNRVPAATVSTNCHLIKVFTFVKKIYIDRFDI